MKISVKIFLLLFFVVAAVGAILIFVKTQLAPPGNVTYHDQYATPLNETVATVGQNLFPDNTDDFRKAYHKINFMNIEELLTDEQADSLVTRVDTIYGSSCVDYAYRLFQRQTWPEDEIELVSGTISALRADLLSDGQPAVTPEMDTSFAGVESVIGNYRDAWAFSQDVAYRSLNDASQRISNIPTYLSMPYLSNNVALVEALNALPAAINSSHYAFVESQVNRLRNYRNYTQDNYNALQQQVLRALTEYGNANFYGRDKKPKGALDDKAYGYLAEAQLFYQKQAEEEEAIRTQQGETPNPDPSPTSGGNNSSFIIE